jgi:hypothetical protein
MPLNILSSTDLKQLLSNGRWALKLIWSTNAFLTVGLVMSTLGRGMVPAGLAVFARGLINVFVGEGGVAGVGMEAVLPWFFSRVWRHDARHDTGGQNDGVRLAHRHPARNPAPQLSVVIFPNTGVRISK